MKTKIVFIILIFTSVFAFPQGNTDTELSTFDKILQLDKPAITGGIRMPIFTLGTGVVSYHGDIMNDEPANFSIGCNAIHFEMQQNITPYLQLGIRYLRSELRGNSYYPDIQTFFNFKTEVNSFGAFARYNFSNFSIVTKHSNILSPYTSLGISFLQRPEARGDWYTGNKKIYLWTDGSFRTSPETGYNASQASIVYRDFEYETALQVENIDNKKYYSPVILTFPVELGIEYNISKVLKINLGYQYHFTATNTLDDITKNGKNDARKGSKLPDGYSYAYVSLSAHLGNIQKKQKFEALDNEDYYVDWDEDQDGIDETEDDCPYTPRGVEVYANGCPLDDDNDGIPNFKDIENQTNAFFRDEHGKGMSEEELIERMTKGDKLLQSELYTYYPDLMDGRTHAKQFYKRIPKKYKICDLDRNDYIDLDELLYTIDSFFDEGPDAGPGSVMTSKDLSELIEFFFLQ